MNTAINRNAVALLLMLSTSGINAATVESEVSNMDTVVIGALAEKVTLRVTGYKNLKGTEVYYGDVYASTTSATGQLAITLGSEHDPKPSYWGNGIGSYYYPQGTIRNADGDEYTVDLFGSTSSYKTIDGSLWFIYPILNNMYQGKLQAPGLRAQNMKPGTYPITVRAALYQQ